MDEKSKFPYDGLGLDIWSAMVPRERDGRVFDRRKEGRRKSDRKPQKLEEPVGPKDKREALLSRMDMYM